MGNRRRAPCPHKEGGRMSVMLRRSTGNGTAGAEQSGLGRVGALLVAVGLAMAAMPFVGPLVGLPFDGSDAWDWNRNRLVLHVLPGLVGAGMGLVLLHAQRRRTRHRLAYPAWLPGVAVGAVVVGVWNGVGPWLLDHVLPASQGSGLMFLGIPRFESFSTAHQLLLEAACHWIPGWLTL